MHKTWKIKKQKNFKFRKNKKIFVLHSLYRLRQTRFSLQIRRNICNVDELFVTLISSSDKKFPSYYPQAQKFLFAYNTTLKR